MPRHPASAALAAISSIASWLVSSIPRWANGANTSGGASLKGSVSGKNWASTRMNGLSGESDWPSHAPWPNASERRSSSSSGVYSLYQAIDASMSLTRSAMCVQRGVGGCSAYICSLTGPPLGDLRVVAALRPQDQRVAPRILEGVVETVELFPVVVAPQLLRAEVHGAVEDRVGVVVVADEDPHTGRVAA